MSRVLRAVRHLREAPTKFTFCFSVVSLKIHADEPATIVVDLTRGPRRVRGNATVELSKGNNELSMNIPLQCNATLFKPKSSPQASSSSSLKRQKSTAEEMRDAADGAAADGAPFLPKRAQLQLLDVSKSRRLGGRLLSRMRPSPSVSFASALPRDPSASASTSLSPEVAAEIRESGVLVAEVSIDLASLAAAHCAGMQPQTLHLPLEKADGQITVSVSLHRLEGLCADEEDCLSVCSALQSPPQNTRTSSPQGLRAAAPSKLTAATPANIRTAAPKASVIPGTTPMALVAEDEKPFVLRLPHKETLPSSLETPTLEEENQQQEPKASAPTVTEKAAAQTGKEGTQIASSACKAQRPLVQELGPTGTATAPAVLSPAERQQQPKQKTHQQHQGQVQRQQRQAELRRKDELIASLQRQVALMEAEKRQAAAPQLAQLFAQIDELHTALAAAQEQQLAAAEQLQQEREKGDSSVVVAALQQQLQDAEQRLQHLERNRQEMHLQQQEMQQKNSEQQQELLQLQAERDGMRLIADAYKKQLEELHQQQQKQHEQQQQPEGEQLGRVLQQAEQWKAEKEQLQNKLADETKEREAALKEVRLLQQQLHQQVRQQQLLQQKLVQQDAHPSADPAAVLQQQIISLQRQLVEAADTTEALRMAKDQMIAELTRALQEMQQKQGEAQAVQQQTMQKLNTFKEETEALREKIRCQEETLQRLPSQAAWSCAQQQHQLLLQQQREWQQQQEQQQREQDLQLAAKTRRIEELERELVYVKVELATAEQRRHEDIDAFKRKLQAVKETVVAYAAASSSSLQAQSSSHSHRASKRNSSSTSSSNGRGSPVKRIVHISTLKALFRPSSHSSTHSRSSNRIAAATDRRPAAAITSKSTRLVVHSRSLSGSRSDLPPRSNNATGSSGSSSGNSSLSSSGKAPLASVSLFGTQPLARSFNGPSVTRFCASKSGGCSVVTNCATSELQVVQGL